MVVAGFLFYFLFFLMNIGKTAFTNAKYSADMEGETAFTKRKMFVGHGSHRTPLISVVLQNLMVTFGAVMYISHIL